MTQSVLMTGSRDLHVAFITDAPRVAGSELWLLDVLPLLQTQGLHSTLFLSDRENLDTFAARFEATGIPVHRYRALTDLPGLTGTFDLRVVQGWTPGTYRRLLPLLATPRLVISHDQLDFHYPQPLRASYLEVYPWTKAGPLKSADTVVTVSQWAGEFMRLNMRLKDVRVVSNGVRTDDFRPATAEERRNLRESLGFTRFTVLVPGRFAPEKNQLAALLAARHAPELDFVFCGDQDSGMGRLASALARRLKLANVRFLGRRWDMPELYRAADILLQPTLAENQSLVTLEAMSSGLPVVTTPIPAQAELVRDGVDGLLVPPQPVLLARALKALAAHPDRARQFGQAARGHVLASHTLEGTAQQVGIMLREVLVHTPGNGTRPLGQR